MQEQLKDIAHRFGAETASLHLLDEAGVLVLVAQVGLPPHIVEIVSRAPMGKGMAGLAAQRNEPWARLARPQRPRARAPQSPRPSIAASGPPGPSSVLSPAPFSRL